MAQTFEQGEAWSGISGSGSVAVRALAALVQHVQDLPLGEQLAQHTVDQQLFARLSTMDLDAADEAALVEAAAAADRLESAAHAMKLRAAAALASRVGMHPAALEQRDISQREVAGDELAVRLRTTVRAGMDLVRRAKALEGPLFATGDALARGVIDAARARVIADGLEHVSPEVAATVEAQVLECAPERTVAQLRADVAKALIAVDAEQAAERARHRARERRVGRPRALADGIASMRLEGPAADVLALDVALQASAKAAKAVGDPRSLDQLRFDTLAGVAHRALTTGHLGDPDSGQDLANQAGHRPTIFITVPLDQLLPAAGTIGTAGAASPGANGTAGPDNSGTAPRDENGAAGLDSRGAAEPGDGAWPPPLPGERLIPGQVPELDGYGPISPTAARALAAGGDWIRIVTDPLTGAVLDVGHTRYRPTQAIIDHVLARDRTCVRPGCGHRARECQLDHTQEWDHNRPGSGGRTATDNLGPLCGRDHTVKTHGDFELSQVKPGVFEWTTPTGHRYRRELDGSTTSLTHLGHRPRYGVSEEDSLPSATPPDDGPPDGSPPNGGPVEAVPSDDDPPPF